MHVFVCCLDKQFILFLAFQPPCEHQKLRLCRLISVFCFLPGNKTIYIVSDVKSITQREIFPSKFKRHYDTVKKMTSKIKYLKSSLRTLICPFRFLFICCMSHKPTFQSCRDSDMVILGSKCVFLIDKTRPPELETNLVIDCLFFLFSCHLEKVS